MRTSVQALEREGTSTSRERHPNVLLIMTDDQGWGDIRSHNNPDIETPVLDSLAAAGARFDRFYVSPVCAPTRAGLLTGRYHLRTGTHGVTRGRENMSADETTIAELFQQSGYATGCFGKWHNGSHYPLHPNGQGFDKFVGFCAGHWNNYFGTKLEEDGEVIESDGYIADYLTDRAIEFIQEHRESPFFCYVPLNTPHSPWQVPQEYFDRYADKGLDEKAACAYAMCANIDDNVGRLLAALDDIEVSDSTIVIFLTDNGPNSGRFNGEMKGRKGSVHEGGVRVPLFVRYPDRVAPGTTIESICANIDLLPTLVQLCQLQADDSVRASWDGVSLAGLLGGSGTEESPALQDRMLYTFRRQGELGAVRTEKWRAVLERRGWSLFDMESDPNQLQDVAIANPDVLAGLSAAYQAKLDEVCPSELNPLPIPLGFPGLSLPAHEAELYPSPDADDQSPGIRYRGGQGWANDWISGWTDPEAKAVWQVDVARSGRYRLIARYATEEPNSETDAQSSPSAPLDSHLKFEITCKVGEQEISVEVTDPFRIEFVESPDRIARGEVFEAVAWGRAELGELNFDTGLHAIELQADASLLVGGLKLKALELERIPDRNE